MFCRRLFRKTVQKTRKVGVALIFSAISVFVAWADEGRAVVETDEPAAPRKRVADLPKVATGANGLVEVVAADVPGDPVGFRLPILQFTTRLVRDVERVYGLEMPRGEVGLLIHAQNGTTNDVRVISRAGRRGGAAITHIWLPSPGFSDLEALRYAIVKGYFRCWIDRARAAKATAPAAEMPAWMVFGALRGLDRATVDADKQTVLTIWSEARLPSFPVLCRDLRPGVGDDAALCGYVVAWLREKRLFRAALEDFAAGRAFDGARLAADLTGEAEPDRQDRAHDERLARLTRSVLTPGRASAWDRRVFASRLLLYPEKFDTTNSTQRTAWTFREAIPRAADDPGLRAAAARKAREMPFCALGRGPQLGAAADAYRRFLTALARGDDPERLGPLLDEAEALLNEILNEDRKDDNR